MKSQSIHRQKRRGFSLLELLAVTTLIGILAAVVVPRLGTIGSQAKGKVCLQYKADLNSAAEKYFIATGQLAQQGADLISDDYYGPTIPVCPVNGSAYQFDASTGRVIGHIH